MQQKMRVFGEPIPNSHASQHLLGWWHAIVDLCVDELTSNLYWLDGTVLVLYAGLGLAGLWLQLPIWIGAMFLFGILVISYRQTIEYYPQGGGAYSVVSENLGKHIGVIAAVTLLVNYVFTVTVSVSDGVKQLTSIASSYEISPPFGGSTFAEGLWPISLALLFLTLVWYNIKRGVHEAAKVFSPFVILYLGLFILLGVVGNLKLLFWGLDSFDIPAIEQPDVQTHNMWMTIFIVLTAFSRSSALQTGTEAISNGVLNVDGGQKTAKKVMAIMFTFTFVMSALLMFLTYSLQLIPNEATHETLISQISKMVWGRNWIYVVQQLTNTFALMLAALTAFIDAPRVCKILADDRYMPRFFAQLGSRLVFDRGVDMVFYISAVIMVIFNADSLRQLPFYGIGSFTTFSLSQLGMVFRHRKVKQPGWLRSAIINGVGCTMCSLVLVMLIVVNGTSGAFLAVAAMALCVWALIGIHRHFEDVRATLRFGGCCPEINTYQRFRIVLIGSVNHADKQLVERAMSSTSTDWIPLHIGDKDSSEAEEATRRWDQFIKPHCQRDLVILHNDTRDDAGALQEYLVKLFTEDENVRVEVLVARLQFKFFWLSWLHGGSAELLESAVASANKQLNIAFADLKKVDMII